MFIKKLGARKDSGWGRIVRRFFTNAGKWVLACLLVLGFAAPANLGTSFSGGILQAATPSAAEIVASRFPSADTTLTFSTANVMPVELWEVSNQGAFSSTMTADPAWPTAGETTAPPGSEPAQQPAEAAKPEPPKTQAANVVARRVKGRSSNVLNDAQIASIKRRLNLTAEQQRMWPAVEDALRKIVYTKSAMDPQGHTPAGGARMAYVDPDSAEIQQLKYAALPLIMRLNDEQKREIKMLAYVMGLESVTSQF